MATSTKQQTTNFDSFFREIDGDTASSIPTANNQRNVNSSNAFEDNTQNEIRLIDQPQRVTVPTKRQTAPAAIQPPKPQLPAGWKLEPEYYEAYRQWAAKPNPATTGNMLRQLQPQLQSAVGRYAGGADKNLQAEAKKITIAALKTYDPKQASLRTHLSRNLQRLQRVMGQQSAVYIPERLWLDSNKIAEMEAELEDRLGRPPSDSELADSTGLSIRRIVKARNIQPGISTAIGERNLEADDQQMAGDYKEWAKFVYDDLDPTDQYILERSLGFWGHKILPANQIAAKLKISPAAVSQRMKRLDQIIRNKQTNML